MKCLFLQALCPTALGVAAWTHPAQLQGTSSTAPEQLQLELLPFQVPEEEYMAWSLWKIKIICDRDVFTAGNGVQNPVCVCHWLDRALGAVSVTAMEEAHMWQQISTCSLCCCTAGAAALVAKEDNPCNPNPASH